MKTKILSALTLVAIAMLSFTLVMKRYTIDKSNLAKFQIDGMLGANVNGTLAFSGFTCRFDPNHLSESKMDVILDVNSISTGIAKRDKHLRSAEYFDVATYPEIRFTSNSIQSIGGGYSVKGELTIKDVKKEISIPFVTETTNSGLRFKGDFKIDRATFHIGEANITGMGDEVRIRIDLSTKG